MSQIANLLELPTELLLEVGRHLGHDESLSTSLACRRLRNIGQEQLMRTSAVCPSRIWKLANTLGGRPDLAKAHTHLRIGRLGADVYIAIKKSLSQQDAARADVSCYMDVISHNLPLFNTLNGSHDVIDTPRSLQLGIVVVLALSPNLCAMSIFTNVLDFSGELLGFCHVKDRSQGDFTIDWSDQVREYVAKRLEKLVVVREKHVSEPAARRAADATSIFWRQREIIREVASFKMRILDVSRCERLETLEAPCSRLQQTLRGLPMMLPPTLRRLCIHGPGTGSQKLRVTVDSLITDAGRLPSLHLVELRFHCNVIATAWKICSDQTYGRSELEKYRVWQLAPFRLITTFGKAKSFIEKRRNLRDTISSYEEGNMIAALERCLAIPREEVKHHPDIAEALGYSDRDGNVDAESYGTNHRGPIVLLGNNNSLA